MEEYRKCKTHGWIPIKEFYYRNNINHYQCRICKSNKYKEYRIKNKEKIKLRMKNYRIENRTHIYEYAKIYRDNNKEKVREWNRINNNSLPNSKVRDRMNTKMLASEIPKEFIDAYRNLILLRRKLKEIKRNGNSKC
jgi:hypothetical protein